VTSGDAPSNSGGVADPRFTGEHAFGQWGVREWDAPAATVTAQRAPGQGPISIADPRLKSSADSFQNIYRIIPFDEPCKAVTGASHVAGGTACVADPRIGEKSYQVKKYKVTQWGEPTRTVIGASTSGDGAFAVADPRFPEAGDKLVCMIRALDNTWHRPFTTLELAALQSLLDPEEEFNLDGNSDSSKRERIGNAVPPAAAEAIANVMAHTLLLAASGETFQLSATPVWVRPMVVALSVKTEVGL
jgi:site-specific DNA-cytosine methylase